MKLLHINEILDNCEDFGYINCDRDTVDSIEFESIIHYLKEYRDLQSKIDKVNKYIDDEINKIQKHEYARGIRRLNNIQRILKENETWKENL